jgi:hypothetical protein
MIENSAGRALYLCVCVYCHKTITDRKKHLIELNLDTLITIFMIIM